MGNDDAWALLEDAENITVAKGKKVVTLDKATITKEEVLKHAMGPSGNLRAPTFKDENRFLIGFHEEAYKSWFK